MAASTLPMGKLCPRRAWRLCARLAPQRRNPLVAVALEFVEGAEGGSYRPAEVWEVCRWRYRTWLPYMLGKHRLRGRLLGGGRLLTRHTAGGRKSEEDRDHREGPLNDPTVIGEHRDRIDQCDLAIYCCAADRAPPHFMHRTTRLARDPLKLEIRPECLIVPELLVDLSPFFGAGPVSDLNLTFSSVRHIAPLVGLRLDPTKRQGATCWGGDFTASFYAARFVNETGLETMYRSRRPTRPSARSTR